MGFRHTTGVVLVLAAVSIALVLGIACGVDKETDTSPLATWDPGNAEVFNQARTEGILEISPSCVRLILDNQESVLLVWPEPTSWNASYQAIEFVSVLGERLELRDGDRIVPGGATPIVEPSFVSAPDSSCEADEMFVLNSIEVITNWPT